MLLLFEMTLNLTLSAVHFFKPDTQWSGLSLVTCNHLFLPATVVKSAGYSQFENESNIISMQLNTLFLPAAISYYLAQICSQYNGVETCIHNKCMALCGNLTK